MRLGIVHATRALASLLVVLLLSSGGVLAARAHSGSLAAASLPERADPALVYRPLAEMLARATGRLGEMRASRARELASSCGAAGARTVSFRVEVQPGLPVTPVVFASRVRSILCDQRSWIASGRVRFRYDPQASVVVRLLDPEHTEALCLQLTGKSVRRAYSCAGSTQAVLNSARWFGGSPTWDGSVADYRRLLVNHEMGHVLGLQHRGCARSGAPAPVMMQQSKGLGGCLPNPWPTVSELRALV